MTLTRATIIALRAIGLTTEQFDAVMEIFERSAQKQPKKGDKADREARGTRLPEDWRLPPELQKYALDIGLTPREVAVEERKFRDYWIQQPGAKGVKLTWSATWRNWCLSMMERAGRPPKIAVTLPVAGPEAFDAPTWRAIAANYKRTGQWPETAGPPPGRMDCQMPDAYL